MKGKHRVSQVLLILTPLLLGLLGVVFLTGFVARAAPPLRPLLDPPWNTNIRVNDSAEGEATQDNPALAASQTTSDVYAIWIDHRNGDADVYFARSADGGQTWGAAVRVSQDTGSAWQQAPDIAVNASGTLHAAWVDSREGSNDIYYARSADSGQTWSQEIRINDVTTRSQSSPAIAILADTVCVGWSDERTTYNRHDIYVDCSSDGGLNWGTDTRVNDDAAGTYKRYNPDIAIASSGRVHVVWYDDRDGDYNIYYTHSSVGGGWSTNNRLNHDPGTATQQTPSVAVHGNTVYAAWQDYRNSTWDLYTNYSTDGGDTWQTSDQKVNDSSGIEQPVLAVDGQGTAWASWRVITSGQYILYSDAYGPNGWGTDTVVTSSTAFKQNPAIAAGGSPVYVAWYHSSTGGDADIFLSAWNGSLWGDAVQVNDEGEARQERPGLAVGSTGTLYAAWMDYRNDANNADLYFARSTDGGGTWGTNVQVSDGGHYVNKAPAIAAAGPLTVHVAWEGDLSGYPAIYYDRSGDGGQTWGTDQQLDQSYGSATSPDVAASGAQTVYVVWSQYSSLYLARSLDGGTTWPTPTQIITSTMAVDAPALVVDVTGTLHLAWEETVSYNPYDEDVCYARSTDGGQNWSDRQCFGTVASLSQQTNPDVAVDPASGRVHFVWEDDRSGSGEIYHVSSADGGLSWGTPAPISSGGPAAEPAVTVEDDGAVYTVWQDGRNGHDDVYYSRSTDGGQNWDTPGRVNDDVTTWYQRHPAVASGSGVYAIWDDFRRVNWDIYATSLVSTACPVPLDEVSISGPSAITTGLPIMLTAAISPADATLPVAYTWAPHPASGQGTAEAVYYWYTPGTYTVTVTASNCGGPVLATHRVIVTAPPPTLPCVEGIVYYAATPLSGVQVDLIPGTDPQANPIQTTTTGDGGDYRFCDVTPGPYYLKRHAPSPEYIEWVAGSINVGGSNLIKNLDLPRKMTLDSPADESIVSTSIPTLTWQSLPEAGRYTLQLNRTADWDLVVQRNGLVETSYQVETPLTWGISYTWQIDAYTGTHWVGTTDDSFGFTLATFMPITFTLPPIASVYSSLRIEDAPEGVVVNKLIGDSSGETPFTYVDIVVQAWTWNSDVRDEVNVILTVPGDQLGAPVNTWVRSSSGGTLTPVAYTDLGGGSYQVTTGLLRRWPFFFSSYARQVVWRFRIPNGILQQDLNLQSHVQVPGYMVFSSWSDATLRLVRYPWSIIVTNRGLLYDHHSNYQATQLLEQLYTAVQGWPHNEQPLGVVYYVDRYSNEARDWDNTDVDYTGDEADANEVADEIDDLIEDWVEDGTGTLSFHLPYSITFSLTWRPPYLLIVGDDDVIPFYRYDDPSDKEGIDLRDCNGDGVPEHPGWCTDSNTNPAILATDEDYFFTDNPYGDLWGGSDWKWGDLELAVGRLLGDSAADMLALLNSSLATDGDTGRAVMASVAGWELGMPESTGCGGDEIHDVLDVPSRLVARGFNVLNDTEIPRTVDVMSPYDAGWNAGFRSAANGGMDIFFIGGHNHYSYAGIPGDDFSPDDTCADATCGYNRFDNDHPLAFIVGCHGGLPVPDVDVPGGVDDDMVYDLAHEGARAYVGATGFSYGSPGSLCYNTWGERLLQRFFDEFLPAGSESYPIGEALRRAKDNYVFGFGDKDYYDRKTVTEFTLYGVPWQRLDYPGGTLAATAVRRMASPSAVTRQAGPIVQADTFRYTRIITVEIASYEATQVITDGTTYDVLSIPGGGMAVAPDLPMLPYVEGYTLTLPLSATVQGVTLTNSTCADAGSYEVPIIVVQPWTEGGTTFTTTTDINTFYPSDEDLVQWQQQGDRMLFTLLPIQHNPTSNATRFCSQMVLQVAYDAPLPLAVSDLHPQAEQVVPGEPITATALVENVGDDLATITTTLTLMDTHGHTVGWQDGGPFSVAAGGQEELDLGWDGLLNEGTYALMLTLRRDGDVVGMAAGRVNVVGGALTSLEVPTTTVMPGEQATFRVTFANYLATQVTTTVSLVIYDEYGDPIGEEISPQTGQVNGQDEATFSFSWRPSGMPGGTYTAWAQVERDDETTYGPAVQSFKVGYNVYLPVVLKNFS